MSGKLRYYNGTEWEQIAPTKQEFDEQKTQLAEHKAESANKAHGGKKGALVYLSANQSIPNGEGTIVNFNLAEYDTNNFLKTQGRLVVPVGVTKVIVKASIGWATSSNRGRGLTIRKNGITSFYGVPRSQSVIGGETNTAFNRGRSSVMSPVLNVKAGDYFDVEVIQNSGGALNIEAASFAATWFAIEVVE